ncbi:MAG: tyrosine-protein phosphatase [Syntrophomonadaceae bacterium]
MIDIHNHILPGLDDGARSIETAVGMTRIAAQSGMQGIIATPHVITGIFDNKRQKILQAVERLNNILKQQNISLLIMPGAEYHLEPDLVRRFNAGELLTLNDTGRYLLVELPETLVPDYSTQILYELQLAGITPVIAHPERNQHLMTNPNLLQTISACGAVMQLTAASLTGLFGSVVQNNAWRLISGGGHSSIVATDAHSTRGRVPSLDVAYLQICARLGKEAAQILCSENPQRVAQGLDLEPCPVVRPNIWPCLRRLMVRTS